MISFVLEDIPVSGIIATVVVLSLVAAFFAYLIISTIQKIKKGKPVVTCSCSNKGEELKKYYYRQKKKEAKKKAKGECPYCHH